MSDIFNTDYLEVEGFETDYKLNVNGDWASPNFELSNLFELIANDGNLDNFKNLCRLMSNYNVINSFNYVKNKDRYETMTFLELNNDNQYQPLSQETANRIASRFYRIQFIGVPKNKKVNKNYLD